MAIHRDRVKITYILTVTPQYWQCESTAQARCQSKGMVKPRDKQAQEALLLFAGCLTHFGRLPDFSCIMPRHWVPDTSILPFLLCLAGRTEQSAWQGRAPDRLQTVCLAGRASDSLQTVCLTGRASDSLQTVCLAGRASDSLQTVCLTGRTSDRLQTVCLAGQSL